MVRTRRDNVLIDALEAMKPMAFAGPVWKIARDGRDPLQCNASGGRWDDGSFHVLYSSMSRTGALEEMRFHLVRGQPVMPSRVRYGMFEVDLALERTLQFLDLAALGEDGLKTGTIGRLSCQQKDDEYPKTQEVGEVARFLDFVRWVDRSICPIRREESSGLLRQGRNAPRKRTE